MNMFDQLLGIDLIQDLTETTWWTDTVVRGLEKGSSDNQDIDFEVAAAPSQLSAELD